MKFFRGRYPERTSPPDTVYWAHCHEYVRKLSDRSIEITTAGNFVQPDDVVTITEIDFLDTDPTSVEILVDALLLSGVLARNRNLSRDSALYCLVNESLGSMNEAISGLETLSADDFCLTEK